MSIRLRLLAALLLCNSFVAADDAACLKCHTNRAELTKSLQGKAPKKPLERLLVDEKRYQRSVHASKGCTECHFDFDTQPHTGEAETVGCAECHEDQQKVHADSIHGKAQEGKQKLPVTCSACHGTHDVYKKSARDSRTHPLNVHKTCGSCHFGKDPSTMALPEFLTEKYLGDVHGHAILTSGLVVAANCVSCHGSHDTRAKGDPESRIGRKRVNQVCGTCHVRAMEQHLESIHRLRKRKDENGDDGEQEEGATCTDCHTPHKLVRAGATFRADTVEACGGCHKKEAETYHRTYHGKLSELGFGEEAATCADCHGTHAIAKKDNPASLINSSNIVETCAKCHKGAHEEFATYMVHADYTDPENYPRVHLAYLIMTSLLIGVVALGLTHVLLWLVRATAAGHWRRPKRPKDERYVRRWSRNQVTYHISLMTSVLMLASTGLPLHYSGRPWARAFMSVLGGPRATAILHRWAAVFLMAMATIFLIDIFFKVFVKREKILTPGSTLLPRKKDFQDFWGMMKWFFFRGPQPKYDRWTYWEKFDFWAVYWGLFIISVTGLMLWFPVHATRIFPGWFLNVAIIVHGIEALLDIAFIFTVHIFHANLRPDKFPMDTMFWTGRMTESEFKHERPLEYERAVREGTYEKMFARTPRPRTRIVAFIIGGFAMLLGVFFVIAGIVAYLVS